MYGTLIIENNNDFKTYICIEFLVNALFYEFRALNISVI